MINNLYITDITDTRRVFASIGRSLFQVPNNRRELQVGNNRSCS